MTDFRIGDATRAQLATLALNDLKHVAPDDNGQRVCALVARQLAYTTVKLTDAAGDAAKAATSALALTSGGGGDAALARQKASLSTMLLNIRMISPLNHPV